MIQQRLEPGRTPALTIRRTPGDDRPYYWRAVAYDHFNFFGWDWTETRPTTPRPAGEDDPRRDTRRPAGGRHARTVIVHGHARSAYRQPYVVQPARLRSSIDRDSALLSLGEDGFFEALQIERHQPYIVTARVPLLGDDAGRAHAEQLAAAGTDYPDEIVRSLPGRPGRARSGPEATQVLDESWRCAGRQPVRRRHDDGGDAQSDRSSRYDTDVTDVDCGDRSVAECFARSKRGYCQHYATLMTVLLREHGIPARFVQGFLPGDLEPAHRRRDRSRTAAPTPGSRSTSPATAG